MSLPSFHHDMGIFQSLRDSFCALIHSFKRDYKNLILYHNDTTLMTLSNEPYPSQQKKVTSLTHIQLRATAKMNIKLWTLAQPAAIGLKS